jgi:iron complex outermembrane receptor protein
MSDLKRFLGLAQGLPLALSCALFAAPVQAQDDDAVLEDEDDTVEEITVTGTRIRRDEYSSPSPIQVLDVESGRQLGLSSIAEMLQRTTVANGNQIDATLNTNAGNSNATEAPPTGGVGSSNVDLRGLGPERTLVLVNGRRMGSNGVRGAPSQPDINLIPFSMVERVEVLTEGVSAVYGADAVAGVVNVILRDEFEGFEVTANTESPSETGGNINQISMIAGAVSDRASLTFGAEFFDRQRVRVGDRDFSRSFRSIEEFEDGSRQVIDRDGFFDNVILSLDFMDPSLPFTQPDNAEIFFFYNPGISAAQSDLGIQNFTSYAQLPPAPAGTYDYGFGPDIQNDGQRGSTNFPYFDFYNDQDERRLGDLVGDIERVSAVTTGKLDLDLWSNEEVFFEAYYLQSKTFSIAATEQIFPDVPGMIPQEVEVDTDGDGEADTTTINVDANGVPILVDNPLNPFPGDIAPILTVENVPQTRDVERNHFRFLTGLRGDLGDSSWSYEGFYSYDRGIGFQAQPILFENHLVQATRGVRLDINGNVTCDIGNNTSQLGSFDTLESCVPIDWSDPNIYEGGVTGDGTFTPEQVRFLVGNRTNRTVVEQTMLGGFVTGDVFEIDGRAVGTAFGAEFRTDEISSQNDLIGVLGLNAAENPLQEGETIGERDIWEVYGEINVPLLETLSLDAAVRYTDEENFGNETTWRGRFIWAPVDYLALSASAGTSFRAPNLREQFLADQGGGISGASDPCINNNIQAMDQSDPLRQIVIDNCIADGVVFTDSDGDGQPDTTVLGTQGVTTIPTSTGGNTTLLAETSDSYTATIQFSQPWTQAFDFDFAVSYWSIEIEDTVEEPTADFIIDECYSNQDFPNLTSGFCGLVSRPGGGNPATNILNSVDVSFINIGEATAKGIDLNTRLLLALDGIGTDLAWSTATTKQLEQEVQIFGPDDRDDNLEEIGTPEWKFTSTLSLRRNEWELLAQNRYIGEQQQDNSDAFRANPFDPCCAFNSAPVSRDVDSVDGTWYTDLSLTYLRDSWSATLGVNNALDEDPPLIDTTEGPNRNNAVSSTGYDFFGRTWFATVSVAIQ